MKLILACLFLLPALAIATDWYVDDGASGANDGTSWTDAWTNTTAIVWGVSGVTAGDTLYISGGTYTNLIDVTAGGTATLMT